MAFKKREPVAGFVLSILFLLGLFLPYSVHTAEAQFPFGGAISFIFYCSNNTVEVTLTAPTPGIYMYVPGGTVSYAYSPPSRIGQWVLGVSSPTYVCMVPCQNGQCPKSYGPLMLMEGASV